MTELWNDSELARLSADLDEELESLFNQVEGALAPAASPPAQDDKPPAEPAPQEAADFDLPIAIAPDDFLDELQAAVIRPEPEEATRLAVAAPPGGVWLEPGLLGEPEAPCPPAGLTAEAARDLSRLIEEAVERGVTAALARLKL